MGPSEIVKGFDEQEEENVSCVQNGIGLESGGTPESGREVRLRV